VLHETVPTYKWQFFCCRLKAAAQAGVEEEVEGVDEVEGAAPLAEVVLQQNPAVPPAVPAPRVDCQADLRAQCAQRPLPEVQVGLVHALWCWLSAMH